MKLRKSLLVVWCASSLGAFAVPMTAGADVGIYFDSAPPAARHEAVPAPRRGYTWSEGYWNAKGKKHVWKAGHWEKDRRGYHLSQPSWKQQNDRWELQRGRWDRGDRDHDGVPNSADHVPDNPVRR